MHQRLLNECSERLARRALAIVAACLRETEHQSTFCRFASVFREVLIDYEMEYERMARRFLPTARHPAVGETPEGGDHVDRP
jgi:hypothetical protein